MSMTEWVKVYDCLAELEEEYGSILREQEVYQPVTEMLLMAKMAKLYALLDTLEHRRCMEP